MYIINDKKVYILNRKIYEVYILNRKIYVNRVIRFCYYKYG